MRTAEGLVRSLRFRGNRREIASDGRLSVGDGEPLTDELRAAIRTHRDALLDLLAAESDLFEERAVVAQYARRHAGGRDA